MSTVDTPAPWAVARHRARPRRDWSWDKPARLFAAVAHFAINAVIDLAIVVAVFTVVLLGGSAAAELINWRNR